MERARSATSLGERVWVVMIRDSSHRLIDMIDKLTSFAPLHCRF